MIKSKGHFCKNKNEKNVTAKHTLGRIRHSKPLILNSKFGLSLE